MSMTFATFFPVTTWLPGLQSSFCSVASIKEVNGNERTQENNFVRSDCDAMRCGVADLITEEPPR